MVGMFYTGSHARIPTLLHGWDDVALSRLIIDCRNFAPQLPGVLDGRDFDLAHRKGSALIRLLSRWTEPRNIQSGPIGQGEGGISTYAYVGNNPYVRIDRKGLDDSAAMFNPEFWGRIPPAHPDYYHLSVSYLIGSASFTLTRSGKLYGGAGPVYGGPKATVNPKGLGVAFASGILSGCDHTVDTVDDYVDGASTGAAAYYGIGAGVSYNSTGSAFETGFGTPGAWEGETRWLYKQPILASWCL
ncbi:hypothetical protein [Luteibacter yeojuensis]